MNLGVGSRRGCALGGVAPTRFALAALLVLSIGSLAWGKMIPMSLEHITKRAETIFVGTVTKMSEGYFGHLPGTGRLVFTDVTLKVEEQWKGKGQKEITLQVPGGRLPDGRTQVASEAPRFAIGERVVVFTTTVNSRPWVYGWDQGKYHVVKRRVQGKRDYPIDKDVLTPTLKKRITEILRKGR